MMKMDDKASRQFWFNFFFVRTEDVVANVNNFLEAWNYTRMYMVSPPCSVLNSNFSTSSFAPKISPPHLDTHIYDWVERLPPHITGIRDRPCFHKKFRPALPSTGNFLTMIMAA